MSSKKKQINKWRKQELRIRAACSACRGTHRNLRQLGDATVLPKVVEDEIVRWINDLRRDGVPASRAMLRMQAKELANEKGTNSTTFSASDTWIKLFLRRHKFALRCRTRQGQTTPADAKEAASKFREEVLRTMVEKNCGKLYNADQTAIFFEYLPRQTIAARGSKTVWVKCGNKDKVRATAMLLGDSDGFKHEPFIMFKSNPATTIEKQAINNSTRNGFGVTVWKEVQPLQALHRCQIYGNRTAWWNADLSIRFLRYHFANRENLDENVLLLWDDFSAHWAKEVVAYANSINVVLLKVPPRYSYVCQPADISWNQPLKSRLRKRWTQLLKQQLSSYKAQDSSRQLKRKILTSKTAKAHMEHTQEDARAVVEELQYQHVEAKFQLQAPKCPSITQWITEYWYELSCATITSGFRKVGLLMDIRVIEDDIVTAGDIDPTVEELVRLKLVDTPANRRAENCCWLSSMLSQ